jgi:putative NADPH-quinone reductase
VSVSPDNSDAPGPIVVLLAHPRAGSFNHALAERACTTLSELSIDFRFHDLYAEGFDPLLRAEEAYTTGQSVEAVLAAADDPILRQHRRELTAARGLVVIHPNWWGMPPAILTGWIDRVLVPGVAYRLPAEGGEPESLLNLRNLLVINTSDTPEDRERELFHDPLESIWGRCLVPYIGNPTFLRIVFRVVADATEPERRAWLTDTANFTRTTFDTRHPQP